MKIFPDDICLLQEKKKGPMVETKVKVTLFKHVQIMAINFNKFL